MKDLIAKFLEFIRTDPDLQSEVIGGSFLVFSTGGKTYALVIEELTGNKTNKEFARDIKRFLDDIRKD